AWTLAAIVVLPLVLAALLVAIANTDGGRRGPAGAGARGGGGARALGGGAGERRAGAQGGPRGTLSRPPERRAHRDARSRRHLGRSERSRARLVAKPPAPAPGARGAIRARGSRAASLARVRGGAGRPAGQGIDSAAGACRHRLAAYRGARARA